MKTLGKVVFTLLITGLWWEAVVWLLVLMNQPYTVAVFGAMAGLVVVTFLWWLLFNRTWKAVVTVKDVIERLKKAV